MPTLQRARVTRKKSARFFSLSKVINPVVMVIVDRLRCGGRLVPAVLGGQLRAAFGATVRQNPTTGFGGHARTEAVAALADQAAGLVSTFHWSSPTSMGPLPRISTPLYSGAEGPSQRGESRFRIGSVLYRNKSRDQGCQEDRSIERQGDGMKSLSARLLLLTVIFVMMAEVLIFVPSVARFRDNYIMDRLEAAHLAILVLDATPDGMVSEALSRELLGFVGAHSVAARRGDLKLSLMLDMPPIVTATLAPAEEGPLMMVSEAVRALTQEESRTVRIVGPSPKDPSVELEIVMEDGPLCAAILAFAFRVFWLSLAISLLTAGMVFLVLRRQLVRPLKRLTRNMTQFRSHPENQNLIVQPSGRRDEVGVAERELAAMQTTIREALTQRKHLAALGTAVAKINHDLRGILSSALVVSDRLENSEDPEVRRVAPGLFDAIERAAALCGRTLHYAGSEMTALNLSTVSLKQVIEDAAFGLPNGARIEMREIDGLSVHADRQQLFRIFSNLFRNAAEAGATEISLSGRCEGDTVTVDIADNGPGLPPRAQENLFKPFEGSAKAGGTGLGLSIARELARSHGGELELRGTSATGTSFVLTIPDKPVSD